jgi:hypothetical protein
VVPQRATWLGTEDNSSPLREMVGLMAVAVMDGVQDQDDQLPDRARALQPDMRALASGLQPVVNRSSAYWTSHSLNLTNLIEQRTTRHFEDVLIHA